MSFNVSIFDNCDFTNLTPYTLKTKVIDNLPSSFITDYNYGATKAALIMPNSTDIIKIPFSGSFNPDKNKYTPFYYTTDHIAQEIKTYNAAGAALKKILVPSRLLGYSHSTPIYLQKKCLPLNHPIPEPSPQITQTALNTASNFGLAEMPIKWLSNICSNCGLPLYTKILYELSTAPFNDFTSKENLGFLFSPETNSFKSVIFDFGGFEEDV